MDETIIKIVKGLLRRWEGQPLDKEKYEKIRNEIYSKTKTNKFAPFSNIKKWVNAARKEMNMDAKKKDKAPAKKASASRAKASAAPDLDSIEVPRAVERSLNQLKDEIQEMPRQEVSMPKAPMVMDKVYLQTITYEMASMRQALDRIGRQLDKLERELNQHRQSGE